MMKRTLCLGLALLTGCSAGFNRGAMKSSLRAQNPIVDDRQIGEIEQLRPQVQLPLDIVVSQPLDGHPWTSEEIAEIASWEAPLRKAGVARRVTILPEMLLADCGDRCTVDSQRRAAARLGADTLLVMSPVTEVDAYVNPLAPLDLTIAGMWLVPAHHRDALTMLEGALIDNRNQYVYAFARGEGEKTSMRPLIFARQNEDRVQSEARAKALSQFGESFIREASELE